MPQSFFIERGIFSAIKLSAPASGPMPQDGDPIVQVLRVGKFNHPKYGEFEITPATLAEMKTNFDNKVRGVDVAFDYFHESDKEASGWPEELFLSEDGLELWAKVHWTPTAKQKLAEREIRYFSPDFAFQWEDPETGVIYKNVLFGGGLTNRPFVKDMAAIVAAETKGEQMKIDELEKLVLKLADDGKGLADAHAAMKAENEEMKKKLAEYAEKDKAALPAASQAESPEHVAPADEDDNDPVSLKAKLAEAKKKLAEHEAKSKQLEESAKMSEKVAAFNVMLSEGKVCAAQKDAFIKGDMTAFAKNAKPVNLSEQGSQANGGAESGGERDDKVLKLAEEKCKADPKLEMYLAIQMANREVK